MKKGNQTNDKYKNEKRREKNKIRKINKHLKFHSNDNQSKEKLRSLEKSV